MMHVNRFAWHSYDPVLRVNGAVVVFACWAGLSGCSGTLKEAPLWQGLRLGGHRSMSCLAVDGMLVDSVPKCRGLRLGRVGRVVGVCKSPHLRNARGVLSKFRLCAWPGTLHLRRWIQTFVPQLDSKTALVPCGFRGRKRSIAVMPANGGALCDPRPEPRSGA